MRFTAKRTTASPQRSPQSLGERRGRKEVLWTLSRALLKFKWKCKVNFGDTYMKSVGALCIGVFLFAALVLGVAAPSAVWALTAPNVVHPTDPGSVLIFHKFLRGTVSVDGTTLPQSSFEISVTCPPGLAVSDKLCTDVMTGKGKTVYLKAKWVCPPQPGSPAGRFYCAETDFLLQTTVFGTVWINPENIPNVGSPDPVVATPACDQGFLIVWAIDGPVTQQPISFNGLLGDAILRPSDDTHVLAYNAVANQSFADVAPGLPVPGASKDFLPFDGTNYRYFTRKFYGTVRYEDDNTKTFLTLLTPNTQANNAFNDDNFIEFNYYNENEELVSRGTDLICWQEVEVPSSTEMNGLKGLVSV